DLLDADKILEAVATDGAHAEGAVVDEDMHAAEMPDRGGNRFVTRFVVGDIGDQRGQSADCFRGERCLKPRQSDLVDVERSDPCALVEQSTHQHAPETAGRAGEDDY